MKPNYFEKVPSKILFVLALYDYWVQYNKLIKPYKVIIPFKHVKNTNNHRTKEMCIGVNR